MASQKKPTLEELRQKKQELQEQNRKLEEEMRQLLEAEAVSFITRVSSELDEYSPYLSEKQRRELAAKLGFGAPVAKTAESGLKGIKIAPKWQLDTGETWTGRGSKPKAFKAFDEAHGHSNYPSYPNPKAPKNS